MRLATIAAATLGVLAIVVIAAPRALPLFIFKPKPLEVLQPRAWGVPQARRIEIAAADGGRMIGWWAPPAAPDGAVILIVHGRSENISTRAKLAERLIADGFGVLLFDFRGYGGSEGRPSETHIRQDVSAYDWLRAQGVEGSRIIVLGQSLGNSPAAQLSATHPVMALVLASPYTSLPEAASDRLTLLPLRRLPWRRNRFEVVDSARGIHVPVIMIVTLRDHLVPIENSKKLARAFRGPVSWIRDDSLKHDGLLEGVVLNGRLTAELRRVLAAGRGSPRAPSGEGVQPGGS